MLQVIDHTGHNGVHVLCRTDGAPIFGQDGRISSRSFIDNDKGIVELAFQTTGECLDMLYVELCICNCCNELCNYITAQIIATIDSFQDAVKCLDAVKMLFQDLSSKVMDLQLVSQRNKLGRHQFQLIMPQT